MFLSDIDTGIKDQKSEFIRTPIETINVLMAGGIRMGTICEIYGRPGSGKSSFAYQTSSNFLTDYENSYIMILDCESSSDSSRLRNAFKIDSFRSNIVFHPSLEACFEHVGRIIKYSTRQKLSSIFYEDILVGKEKLLDDKKLKELIEDIIESDKSCKNETIKLTNEEKKFLKDFEKKDKNSVIRFLLWSGMIKYKRNNPLTKYLIIWDTIAAAPLQEEFDKLINNNEIEREVGYNVATRRPIFIKGYINSVLSTLYDKPIAFLILNQVSTTGFGDRYGTSLTTSGGHALQHAIHYRFFFDKQINEKNEYSGEIQGNKKTTKEILGTRSRVSIEKSKFSTKMDNINIYIDDTKGGVITKDLSGTNDLFYTVILLKLFRQIKRGSKYYGFFLSGNDETPISDVFYEGFSAAFKSDEAYEMAKNVLAAHYRLKFKLLDCDYEESGIELGKGLMLGYNKSLIEIDENQDKDGSLDLEIMTTDIQK